MRSKSQILSKLRADGQITDEEYKMLEQDPYEDEYIKVPKKALKYRTAGMVAYNVAWLREHWQMEMDIVCGVKPCDDAISRQAAIEAVKQAIYNHDSAIMRLTELPPVNPQPKTGHWIEKAEDYYKAINEYGGGVNENTDYFVDDIACPKCLSKFSTIDNETERFNYCPNCGAKMVDPQESEE